MLLAKPFAGYKRKPVADTRSKDQLFCDAVQRTADPTGTKDIRRRYTAQAQIRFRQVRKLLQVAVVKQDVLGLRPETVSPLALAYAAGERAIAFQRWVDNLLLATVIEQEGSWLGNMCAAAYIRAVKRAMRLTGKNVAPNAIDRVNTLNALVLTELQGIVEAVSQRILRAASTAYIDKLTPERVFIEMEKALLQVGLQRARAMIGMLTVKAFTQGTLDQFEAAGIKRVGLVPETKPKQAKILATRRLRQLAKQINVTRLKDAPTPTPEMTQRLGRLVRNPGSRISREEAPSRRTVQRIRKVARELEQLEMVNIQTAGDEFVCQICEDIEDGNPYTIDEARSIIPAHVECRCAFVPLDEGMPDDDGLE